MAHRPSTGELTLWSSDTGIDGHNPIDLDELDHLIPIDQMSSRVAYRDMADFAAALSDEREAAQLSRALDGPKPFRRFRNEIHQRLPHLVPVWNAFQQHRANGHAVEWLYDNNLIDEPTFDRYRADHPDPDVP